ncbi:MAG: adenylate/guanylate cyclase domain-containing protein [Planctomycetota bacterium]
MIKLEIRQDGKVVYQSDFSSPIELGRQRLGEPAPFTIVDASPNRLIVAPRTEVRVSRAHCQLRPQGDQLHLSNSSRSAIPFSNDDHIAGSIVSGSESMTMRLPANLAIGNLNIKVEAAAQVTEGVTDYDTSPGDMVDLSTPDHHRTVTPLKFDPVEPGDATLTIMEIKENPAIAPDRLASWLNTMLKVFQDTAGRQEFFDRAAASMVRLLELDTAAVLFCEGEDWTVKAAASRDGEVCRDWQPSRSVLNQVYTDKRSVREVPKMVDAAQSLMNVVQLVAAPVVDSSGTVIGAVYGDRRLELIEARSEFSDIETMFVELIASGVATALARLEQEREVVKAQVRFEQFFTPELATRLEADPNLLEGRNADVSLMFADIRGFSRIAERIGPAQTIKWINGVMDDLSDFVMNHKGVIVDYIGDELMALWGAPEVQPNHSELSVRSALAMLEALPAISQKWEAEIGEPLRVGIGINSGPAQVGNTGSNRKFKYGPLGNTVNVASRLQNATKQVKMELLITKATAQQLPSDIALRKVCQVRFVNVSRPETIFQVLTAEQAASGIKEPYEAGLDMFEAGDFSSACKQLANVVSQFPDDGPTLLLLARAVDALRNDEREHDPVWTLDHK